MWRLIIWCVASGYILAGLPLAPFHGDEGHHLWQSQDYVAYFVLHQPPQVKKPLQIDSGDYMRLLNGTVSAYVTGFILWQTQTLTLENWQPAWYFGEDVATNRAAGRYPKPAVLNWGRLSSSLFLMGAVALLLTWEREGLIIAILLASHPVILLNSRRVMQEGALIFFTIALLRQALQTRAAPTLLNYSLYGVLAGLALASKPSALIPLAGLTLVLYPRRWVLAGGVTLLVYGVLTPAIWSNPLQMTLEAAHLRAETLKGQTQASGAGYQHLSERMLALWENPFPATLQYYESPAFAEDADLADQIRRYDNSLLRGWNVPPMVGWIWASFGLRRLWREYPALLPWVILSALILLIAVPLAWQRYYLPWTVASLVLVGFGILESYELGTQFRTSTLN